MGTDCVGLGPHFWNSIKFVVPAVAISTFLGAVNGYALTKFRFRGAKVFSLAPGAICSMLFLSSTAP
jgi:glucose/mannose transport system permease protein